MLQRLMTSKFTINVRDDGLWESKWCLFERRVRLFKHVPFAEFVLLAGSMATGKVHKKSDFDVIVGVREGRIWTTLFLSSLIFHLRGWRDSPRVEGRNRIGLSHFATPNGYRLNSPHDAYWENLYQKLIPAIGDEEKMKEFFLTNDWLSLPRIYKRHEKYIGELNSLSKKVGEFLLDGLFGDWFEIILKKSFEKRVKDSKKLGYKSRAIFSDERLEFYRDTKRIEEMLREGKV